MSGIAQKQVSRNLHCSAPPAYLGSAAFSLAFRINRRMLRLKAESAAEHAFPST